MSMPRRQVNHIVHMILGLAILLGTVLWAVISGDGEKARAFVDLRSAIWVGGVVVSGLCVSFGPVVAFKAFAAPFAPGLAAIPEACSIYLLVYTRAYELSWAAGLVGMLVNLIIIFHNLSDPSHIGGGVAVSLLIVLYGAMLAEFVFAPLRQVLVNHAITNSLELAVPLQPYRSVVGIATSVAFAVLSIILVFMLSASKL